MEQVRTLAERAQIPVALTLLGLGDFPASHPLNLGMMGMHGESWVNHAIQEADLLIACGMRFDDRVTGTLPPMRQRRRRFTSRSTLPRSTKTSRSMSHSSAICARCSKTCCRASPDGTDRHGSRQSNPARARWRSATSRICRTRVTSMPRT